MSDISIKMKKKILIVILLFFVSINKLVAQDFKVNINKLTEETQQLSESNDKMRLVWWIPVEYWEAIFTQDQTISKLEADKMLSILEKYTMLAIIDGDISESGTISYVDRDETFNKLVVIDKNKNEYTPLLEEEIDLDTKNMVAIMKPILGNMLGRLGENMHFFLFQKRDNPLEKIVDPKNKELFEVKVSEERFVWKLPLGALLKPKLCPVDNQPLDGSWDYCPYHGSKLTTNK